MQAVSHLIISHGTALFITVFVLFIALFHIIFRTIYRITIFQTMKDF
jgi:hypothetical protein